MWWPDIKEHLPIQKVSTCIFYRMFLLLCPLLCMSFFIFSHKVRASFLHADHVFPSLMVSSGALENMNVLTDTSALGDRCQRISLRLYSYSPSSAMTWQCEENVKELTLTHLCHISQTSPFPQRQNSEWATDKPEGKTYSLYTSPRCVLETMNDHVILP